jgi:hypothetical protein
MSRYFFILIVTSMLALGPRMKNEVHQQPYAKLPMSFEENRGQFADEFQFSARGPGYSVLLNASSAVLKLQSDTLAMKLIGADPHASMRGLDLMPGEANYFSGPKEHWITGIPMHRKIEVPEIYPGIDVTYYGNQGRLEYDFVVHSGASPETIRLNFEGASAAALDGNGDLMVTVNDHEIRQPRPTVFQDIDGKRVSIEGEYALRSDKTVGFSIGAYDHSRTLVIDPQLSFSIYLGDLNYSHGIAIDPNGNTYICGETVDPWNDSSRNAFVAKINAEGTAELYYNSFGGDQTDVALAITADASGNAYVTGYTAVGIAGHPAFRQFPVMNPIQQERTGAGQEVFITKFDAEGKIVYSTTLGGSENDQGTGIAVDPSGNIHVTGETSSKDFPTRNAFQSSLRGDSDAFVSVLNPQGSAFVFSTYLGGGDVDRAAAIAVDSGGNSYLTGQTQSSDFPVSNAARRVFGGGTCQSFTTSRPCKDAFVVKIDAQGSALQYATYIGGSSDDQGNGIAVDVLHNAWIIGSTSSPDFPIASALQSRLVGPSDAFITKISPDGSALSYSTFLGGSGSEQGNAIAIDVSGNVYVTGATTSAGFPQTRPLQTFAGSSDAFVTKLPGNGSALIYSTFLSGSSSPTGNAAANAGLGIAVDAHANVYVAGVTGASDFPITGNPTKTQFTRGPRNWGTLAGGTETFVTKVVDDSSVPPNGNAGGAPWTRFEQSSSSIAYVGNWYTNPSNIHSGGSAALAIDPDARATFTFNGAAARWIAYRYSWSGIARVYIDGAFQQIVDGFAADPQPQSVLYMTPTLPPGIHTLTIEVTGTHGSSAQSSWVWVDAFDAQ